MMIEVSDELASALTAQATAHGVSAAGYVHIVLERELNRTPGKQSAGLPFKTGHAVLAKYGSAPSAQEIEASRAEMFHNFGERA
jgi:hypothetical protein